MNFQLDSITGIPFPATSSFSTSSFSTQGSFSPLPKVHLDDFLDSKLVYLCTSTNSNIPPGRSYVVVKEGTLVTIHPKNGPIKIQNRTSSDVIVSSSVHVHDPILPPMTTKEYVEGPDGWYGL